MGFEDLGNKCWRLISPPVPSLHGFRVACLPSQFPPPLLPPSPPPSWAATRIPSSKHTVRRAGSLTLSSSWTRAHTRRRTVSRWSSRCSSKGAFPLIPCQVKGKIKCVHHSVMRVCVFVFPSPPASFSILFPPFIDDTFFSPLSCFPGFSLSFPLPVPICPFSFSCLLFFFSLPVYAHRCRCCAVKRW